MNAYIEKTDAFMASLHAETYRVGGSVRDELLGRKVKDADYMVRGLPLDALGTALRVAGYAWAPDVKVSKLSLRDGRQAGWRVSGGKLGLIEVVLPRTEVSTGPGHRDFEIVVDHTLSLAEDAKRRDFTFNALYRPIVKFGDRDMPTDSIDGVLDPTKTGLFDLERGYIRTTHPASFRDDPLRTLRALRFMSTLGYDLATNTEAEMREHAKSVTGLSIKGTSGTVWSELEKLLGGQAPAKALRMARDTGVLAEVLPELAPMIGFEQGSRYHDMTTDEHTFTAIEHAAAAEAPIEVMVSLLFHDSGKPATAWHGKDGRMHYYSTTLEDGTTTKDHAEVGAQIWKDTAARLNVPNAMRKDVTLLIENHMVGCDKVRPARVAKARIKFGDRILAYLYVHRAADACGKGRGTINMKHLNNVVQMNAIRKEMSRDKVPCKVADLEITGRDAIEKGYASSDIGKALNRVLVSVATQPNEQKRSREWQLSQL